MGCRASSSPPAARTKAAVLVAATLCVGPGPATATFAPPTAAPTPTPTPLTTPTPPNAGAGSTTTLFLGVLGDASPTVVPTSASTAPTPAPISTTVVPQSEVPFSCDSATCLAQAAIKVGNRVIIGGLQNTIYNGLDGKVISVKSDNTFQVQLDEAYGVQTVQPAHLQLVAGEGQCSPEAACRRCPPCSAYTTAAPVVLATSTAYGAVQAAAAVAKTMAAVQPRPANDGTLACMAPVVVNAEGISCDQGQWIPSSSICTADCADGYYASTETLECFNGTLMPATFECINWYNSAQSIALLALVLGCCLVGVSFLIVFPHIMKSTGRGAAYRAAPSEANEYNSRYYDSHLGDRTGLLHGMYERIVDHAKTQGDEHALYNPGQHVSVQDSHGDWRNADIQHLTGEGFYRVMFEHNRSYEEVSTKRIRLREERRSSVDEGLIHSPMASHMHLSSDAHTRHQAALGPHLHLSSDVASTRHQSPRHHSPRETDPYMSDAHSRHGAMETSRHGAMETSRHAAMETYAASATHYPDEQTYAANATHYPDEHRSGFGHPDEHHGSFGTQY